MSAVFQYNLKVQAAHLDALQHVNNVHYLQWVQDIAAAHWQELTKNSKVALGVWGVRSHAITFKNQAQLGDVLTLKTYVKQSRGALSERIVEIYKAHDQTLVVQCSTQWCYLDSKTLKTTKIPQNVMAILE